MRGRQLGLLTAIFALTFVATAWGGSGNDACVSRINNDARKVLDARAKANRKCVKSHPGTVVTGCVDGSDTTTEARKSTLTAHYQSSCGSPPLFGLAPLGPALVNSAAEGAATAIVHDLFGAAVNVSSGDTAKCQESVVRRAGGIAVTMWKTFRACKKKGLPGFADANALAAACLGGPNGPQPDPKSKLSKSQGKLTSDVQKRCIGKAGGTVGSAFPGHCTGVADGQFANCAGQQVKCRVCLALKAADALPASALDCDRFDDGASNASCGPPFTPTSTTTPTMTPTATAVPGTATRTRTATPFTPAPTPTIPEFCDPDLSIPGLVQVPVTLQPGTMSCGGQALNPPPLPPLSGEVDDANSVNISDLGLGCLYAGNLPPVPLPGGTARLGVVGVTLLPPGVTLAGSAGTGPTDCTLGAGPGKHCVNGNPGTDMNGACETDADCGAAKACALDANCFFGPPIPIVAGIFGTCVMNTFLTDLCGTATLAPASANFATTLSARVYLGDFDQPCPLCTGGTCDSGKNVGGMCAPVGSANTSVQCPPRDDQFFTALTVPIPQLTTGVASLQSPTGFFCPAQTLAGAFGLPNARTILENGAALGVGTNLSMTLAGTFCIPGAGGLIDSIAKLPAPGAIAVTGDIDLTGIVP